MTISRYPGVVPFDDTKLDCDRFFGRKKEADDLLHRVLSVNLLVLYGKSGLGKTSLLNAGLFPQLRERDFLPLMVRFNQQADSALRPIDVLAESIQKICEKQDIDYTGGNTESYWEFFKTAIFWKKDRLQTPVLVLDQFEEVFTLQKEPYRREIAEQLGELIGRRLPEYLREKLLQHEKLPFSEKPPEVKILVSLREDYLGMLQELSPQIPDILQRRFRLLGLSQDSAKLAVVNPGKLVPEDFDPPEAFDTCPFDYAPETLNDMIKDACDDEGAVEPFVLQIFCQNIEKEVEKKQLEQSPPVVVDSTYFGGEKRTREEILASYYAANVARAAQQRSVTERLVRNWFQQKLLTEKGVRRSVLESDALKDGLTPECLDMLDKAYLIRSECHQDRNRNCYEVGHDRMISPIINDNEIWRKKNLKPFQFQSDLWAEHHDDKLLIGGSLLADSKEWASNNRQDLTEIDEAYIQACEDTQEAAEKLAEQERQTALERAEQEHQKELRLQLVPQALAAQAFMQHSRGSDELAGLLARQSVLLQRKQRAETLVIDQITNVATNDQLLYEILSSICSSQILETYDSVVSSVAFSLDGCTLATGHHDGTVRLWYVFGRYATPQILPRQNGRITSVCFATHQGRQMLVSGCSDHMVRLYRLDEPSKGPIDVGSHEDEVTSVAFWSDSNEDIVASGGRDCKVRLWSLNEPSHELACLSGHGGWVWSVAFSPKGKTIAAGVRDGTVWLWDWKEIRHKILNTGKGEAAEVFCVALSPNGRWLAVACHDWLIRVWGLNDPDAAPAILSGHKNSVRSVSFSPEGLLVSGGEDQTIRLWNPAQHETPLAEVLNERQRRCQFRRFQSKWRHVGSWMVERRCQNMERAGIGHRPVYQPFNICCCF